MLKDLFGETLQETMETMEAEGHDVGLTIKGAKTTGNRRNGRSKKTVFSEYGDSKMELPRDRGL